jgi:hypothetical protein
MGLLTDFDLRHLITDYGCRILVETGTGAGKGVDEAAELDFLQIFSIEPQHKSALQVALRHAANHKVTIVHAKIAPGLNEVLDEMADGESAIFWMDAHHPGADGRPPLESQLRLICGRRDVSRDIFLIDDLRLYENGIYDEGPCLEQSRPSREFRDLGYIDALFGKTHEIQRSLRRTGYLCVYPLLPEGS